MLFRRFLSRFDRVLSACAVVALGAFAASAQGLVINEFLASNTKFYADEDGDFGDWIELHNPGATAVSLDGWYLTDDPDLLTKWRFPAVSMPAGGYLVVHASGKDRRPVSGRLHTNFQLTADGEFLALVRPDGETVANEFAPAFPPQTPDVSFGRSGGSDAFFQTPTPGAANGAGFAGQVADTKFSHDRAFYDVPFDLTITTETPGATIRYTTNGLRPTATTGLVYSGPIRIAGTTALRAAAFRSGYLPSNTDTHTYLFLDDVIRQSPSGQPPPGWPSSWGGNEVNYGMDPEVVNDPRYRDTIKNDLKTIPSFCVVMNLSDLFSPATGIYANAGNDGIAWERPTSLELVYPDGREGFQIDAGIRIRGGFSRSGGNPKHAFRLFFRQEYGAGKLQFPLFGEGAADEFDAFDLRTFQNYSWSFQGDSRGVFLRDQFSRDTQLAMGHQAERGDFYHLYINGVYWGLYNTCERPEASYGATYYGGTPEEYDVVKVEAGPYSIVATDGNLSAWSQLYNLCKAGVSSDAAYQRLLGNNPDGSRNAAYPVLVDPENLVDYMLIILYGGNLDAPISNFLGNTSPNNFFGLRNRNGDFGFQFFAHDAEHTLLNINEDRTGPYPSGDSSVGKSNPQWIWQKLLANAEFRVLAGDRVHRHFFNGGALTPELAREHFLARKAEIDRAVVGESARWGDSKTGTAFKRDPDWVNAIDDVLNNFIAGRSAVVLNQLKSDSVYPTTAAPSFNQHGGAVNKGFGLLMSAPAGTIYFTLDGSDPRLPGGAVSPSAATYSGVRPLTESVTVKARARNGVQWSALNEADFTIAQTYRELLITELMYHPAASADRDGDDFEFIELKNVGPVELDLSGVRFTNGVGFRFPNGRKLAPGRFAVLVRNPAAFTNRYSDVRPDGVFTGGLANNGERVTLVHAVGTEIFSVGYDTRPPWPQTADGGGFSLVPVNPNANANPDAAGNWRASTATGGSPGRDDPASNVAPVLITEALTHTDPPQIDAIELHNPTGQAADIGNWWLSDDRLEPRKYRIPAGTTIAPDGYRVFDERHFGPGVIPTGFRLNSHGTDVYLHSGDAAGNLTGYSDGFSVGASANGVSFGRHVDSIGEIHYPAQTALTLNAANAGPRVGPVVINEIHYQPAAGDVEFVELKNITGQTVQFFDPETPTNTWRVAGADYAFPQGTVLPAGGLLLVVAGDPSGFRVRHGVPAEVPVLGPVEGVLQNGGERLAIERPDAPDLDTNSGTFFIPYITVDEVRYNNRAPWPTNAAGLGASLERKIAEAYGDDPAAWRESFGTPSPGIENDGNRAPIVSAGPDVEVESTQFPLAVVLSGSGRDDALPAGSSLRFTWSQGGGPGPVTFTGDDRTNATARLPGSGTFTLRLSGTDGERTTADEVTIVARRPSGPQTLIAAGATWKYLDDGSDQGTAWRARTFNDAGWASGPAPLGYGDGDEATTVGYGPDPNNRFVTTYFRRKFNVTEPGAVTGLTVKLQRDDGAVIYLNGTNVFRSNLPEGDVGAGDWANAVVGGGDESAYFEQTVDPAALVAGENVIAVEVHQANGASSDISFDLALEALVLPENRRPTVNAGADFAAEAGTAVALAATYSDDGLPSPPGVPALAWRQMNGPASAAFSATNVVAPMVTFPQAGTYELMLEVNDGALAAADAVVVEVGGDGFDAWRAAHFTAAELADPAISGEHADPDGDGHDNRQEFRAGTDPRDRGSVLGLAVERAVNGQVTLRFNAAEGRAYRIEASPTLEDASWIEQASVPAGSARVIEMPLGEIPSPAPEFFRIVLP